MLLLPTSSLPVTEQFISYSNTEACHYTFWSPDSNVSSRFIIFILLYHMCRCVQCILFGSVFIECVFHCFRESSLLWPGETKRSGRGSAEPPRGHFHPRVWLQWQLQTSSVPPVDRILLVRSGGHWTAHSWNIHQVIFFTGLSYNIW